MAFPYDMSGPSSLTNMNLSGPGTGQSSAGMSPMGEGVPNIMGILRQILGGPLQAGMHPEFSAPQKTQMDEHDLLLSILEAMRTGKLS